VEPSAGLSLREVARRTGLSLPTIRRYVRSGRIHAALEPGAYGRQWKVAEEELLRFNADLGRSGTGVGPSRPDHGSTQIPDQPIGLSRRRIDQQVRLPDQSKNADQESPQDSLPQEFVPAGDPSPVCRLREEVAYWRGRWDELRNVLEHLSQARDPRVPTALEEEELETVKEALRQRSQELAQARNLVDRLRHEKARLEEEVQAFRGRVRSAEPTMIDGVPAAGRPRFEGMNR